MEATAKDQLKRYLYLGSDKLEYRSGHRRNVFKTTCKLAVLPQLLESANRQLFINTIEVVNSEKALPHRENLFLILACALKEIDATDNSLRGLMLSTASNMIKSFEDLCTFIQCATHFNERKFPTGLNRVASQFFLNVDINVLVDEVVSGQKHHSWSQKDLLKLSHCKCAEKDRQVVFAYILYGLERAKVVSENVPEVATILEKLSKLDQLKRSEEETKICELIPQLNLDSTTRIPSFFHKSAAVWETLLPQMPVDKILTDIMRLYRMGFLKNKMATQRLVVEALSSPERVVACGVHPVDVFIIQRLLEKEGGPLDPRLDRYLQKLESSDDPKLIEKGKQKRVKDTRRCQPVVTAIHKCIKQSFQNVQSTGKRTMLVVDMREKMSLNCWAGNKTVNCLDAAVIMIQTFVRVEREVTVGVFNGNSISIVPLDKKLTMNQITQKLKAAKSGLVKASPMFEWAIGKRQPFDLFIAFVYYNHWLKEIKRENSANKDECITMFNKYRKDMSLPHSKFVVSSLHSPRSEEVISGPNVLQVFGFDENVPKVIDAFSRGLFC